MTNDSINHLANSHNPLTPKSKKMPTLYVYCWEAAKKGLVHGMYIDATKEIKDIHADIQNMLATSPVPNSKEWKINAAIDFGLVVPGHSLEIIRQQAIFIQEYGNLGIALLLYYTYPEQASAAIDMRYLSQYTTRWRFCL